MTKAVTNREICFIKAMYYCAKWALFSTKFEDGVFYHPPIPLGLKARLPGLNCGPFVLREQDRLHIIAGLFHTYILDYCRSKGSRKNSGLFLVA